MTPLVHTVESIVSSHGTRFEVYGFVLSTLWLGLQTVSSLERCMSLCPLVKFHFNILYSSGTVVGATECVCPGIRAVASSKTQLTYPLMPAMKNDNAL